MPKTLWVHKYRPKTVDDYIFQNKNHKKLIEGYIEDQSIPNLLMSGPKGTGKTSLAYILKDYLEIPDSDFMESNASDDTSVENIRTKVKSFIQTIPLGDFKIVFLDEADRLSPHAQDTLKKMMEDYTESVRFILTCNKPHRIIPEIKDRCQEIVFKGINNKDMIYKAATVLSKEGVKVDDKELLEKYVKASGSSLRNLIQMLEQNTHDGKLGEPMDNTGSLDALVTIATLLEDDKWEEARKTVCENITDDQWDEVYRFLYDYLEEMGKFAKDGNKWKAGIVVIADHLYRHGIVADPEINFAACMIRLSQI